MDRLRNWSAHPLLDVLGKLMLSVAAGACFVLGCTPHNVWPLGWVGLLFLFFALFGADGQPRTRYPFLWGWITGITTICGGFPWVAGLIERFEPQVSSYNIPIFLVFSIYHGLVFALFAKWICFLRKQLSVSFVWIAAVVWVACEFIFPTLFPWYIAITQAWMLHAIQISEITGVVGVSMLLALASGALFEAVCLVRRGRVRVGAGWKGPFTAALIIPGCLIYGAVRIHQVNRARAAAPVLTTGIVQSNVGMDVKFKRDPAQQLSKLQQASAQLDTQGVDLIVWPESAYPFFYDPALHDVFLLPHALDKDFSEANPKRIRRGFQAPLIFGGITQQRTPASPSSDLGLLYNSALLLGKDDKIHGVADKMQLMPFSEHLPFFGPLQPLWKHLVHFQPTTPGRRPALFPFSHQGRLFWLGPSVCLDAIVPSMTRMQMEGPLRPNLLVNITNDAWFGATAEPSQHLALAVFRSVEHRLDMVRATNTGVSAFIEATGRISVRTEVTDPKGSAEPPTVARQPVRLLSPGTFYARYGYLWAWGCLVLAVGWSLVGLQRARKPFVWGPLLVAAAAYHLALFVLAWISSIPLKSLYNILLQRDLSGIDSTLAFRWTWMIILALLVQSIVVGSLLSYWGRFSVAIPGDARPLRWERLMALVATTVLPVVFWGNMDGNTPVVAAVTLLCIGGQCLGELFVRIIFRSKTSKNNNE